MSIWFFTEFFKLAYFQCSKKNENLGVKTSPESCIRISSLVLSLLMLISAPLMIHSNRINQLPSERPCTIRDCAQVSPCKHIRLTMIYLDLSVLTERAKEHGVLATWATFSVSQELLHKRNEEFSASIKNCYRN